MVLHTWNQRLDAHWHVHCVVPGGGPSLDDSSWRTSRRPGSSTTGDYLVDAINLRTAYRKIAISHLKRLYKCGELKLEGEFSHLQDAAQWKTFIAELESKEWVSYIEPPPQANSKPEHVVRYLARYLTGGPISDARILEADEHQVTFLAREGKTTGGEEIQVPVTLTTEQFVQRWCLHIQPDQLTKTRYFGGWSNTLRRNYLQRCQALNRNPALPQGHPDSGDGRDDESTICPHCGEALLRMISRTPRPSWKELLNQRSEHCPSWYRQTLIDEERTFWDNLMGEGYSDWYDEHIKSPLEVARATPRPSPPIQLTLPGICLSHYD